MLAKYGNQHFFFKKKNLFSTIYFEVLVLLKLVKISLPVLTIPTSGMVPEMAHCLLGNYYAIW
eukprot:SAG31_NODE_486_length_15001_cov_8.454405_10_plen_63_part_00